MSDKQAVKQILNTVINTPSLTFEEKQKIFELLTTVQADVMCLTALQRRLETLIINKNLAAIRELIGAHE